MDESEKATLRRIGDKEKRFYDTLEDIFVGADVEGRSGFINMMRIKSSFFKIVLSKLNEDVDKELKEFPEFREELFDKLYNFFKRYFSESGSIHFAFTPLQENVWERVYTDKDTALFWKTRNLYYVKTDRIWRSMNVEVNGFKFLFDASQIEHRKAYEKREIIYELSSISKDGTINFKVSYSERGRKTNIDELLSKLRNNKVTEEILEKAFRVFEKQNEVDYFINKDANRFLKEQFDIWLRHYLMDEESVFSEKRLKQLKALKNLAFKIIDFISQFEDELRKIWEKPKFVLNSNYVITLDRIARKENGIKVIEKIIRHKGFEEQKKEWKELGILKDEFDEKKLFINTLEGKELNEEYQFLPIDTKYFDEDIKLEILSLFDNLDNELDGWLIKSENWQALNTILPKFRGKVQTIYIDPPFNKEQDADYFYHVKYKDSTWITMLENRVRLGRELLNEKGSIFVRCDYNGNAYVRMLLNDIFGEENFRNEIIINRKRQPIGTPNKFEVENEFLFLFGKTDNSIKKDIYRQRSIIDMKWTGFLKQGERKPPERVFFGKVLYPPEGQHFSLNQEKVDQLLKEQYLRLKCSECGTIYYWDDTNSQNEFYKKVVMARKDKFKYFDISTIDKVYGVTKIEKCLNCGKDKWKVEYLTSEKSKIGDNWKDITSYEDNWSFPTENSEILLKRVIESTSNEGDLVMDFFLGSGTATAVAHKLKRKWIGVEMQDEAFKISLNRMKKVLAYDKSGISKEKDVKEKYNENNCGGFFKYYMLEQYEQTLDKAIYRDTHPFVDWDSKGIYSQYVFLKDEKMLRALEIDYKNGKVKVDLSKLYNNIDIAETLSNLKGKWIKKLTRNKVEFEDGETIDLENLDWKLVKPLIWW